ncbi:mitochondrial export translocase-like protein Oxa1 [Calycina marina]|uniref:Mitochondrial export translocase-like protein Oxa1 n=1 Tax=Calycina marina TaxID=1763456 RepID=A0A9P7Z3N8_9HELO|nr:mitochondrial export translocase-like protein Oxa1 [Calycina marina]
MILSRTLRWSSQTIGLSRQRLEASSTRQFTSSIHNGLYRSSHLSSRTSSPVLRFIPRTQLSQTTASIRNDAGIRFASTTPITTAAPIITTSPAASISAADPEFVTSLDNLTGLSSIDSMSNLPEQIGYLKSLGLEYGWGPTSMMEWLLEHVHVFAGTPWWISIGITAVVVRVVLLKFYVGASDVSARLAAIKPMTDPFTEDMKAAQKRRDTAAVMMARSEISQMHKKAGIKVHRAFIPMLQVFTGYGTWKLLRAMSLLPVPGFEDGGALWFYNLAVPDPYFLFPLATSGMLYYTLKKGGETGASTMSPQATKILSILFPVGSFLLTFWLPASVQLSFLVTSIMSFCQMNVFQSPRLRERLGMYPLKLPSTAAPAPYNGLKVKQAPVDPEYQAPRPPGLKNFVADKFQENLKYIKDTVNSTAEVTGFVGSNERKDAKEYEARRKSEILEQKQIRDAFAAEKRENRKNKGHGEKRR